MSGKAKIGFISGGIPNISPNEAFELCEKGAIIIDIRSVSITSFKKFGVEDIIYYSQESIFSSNTLNKNKTYIVAESSTSINSREIVKELIDNGFNNVYNLAGGFVEWERDNLPIITNIEERLSGSCMCQLKPRERKKKP